MTRPFFGFKHCDGQMIQVSGLVTASVLAAHTAPAEVAIESGGVASSHQKFPPLAPPLILFPFYRARCACCD